jgi:hypothetical protein
MKKVIEGHVVVRHGTLVDRVYIHKGDQGDILTRTLVEFEDKNVKITIEEVGAGG